MARSQVAMNKEYRQKTRAELDELRRTVPALKTRIAELEGSVLDLQYENAELKEKLAATPASPPTPAPGRLGPLTDAERRAFREWCAERGEAPGNDAMRKFMRESLDAYAARKSSAATPAPTVDSTAHAPAALAPAPTATPEPKTVRPETDDDIFKGIPDIPDEEWSVGGYIDPRKQAKIREAEPMLQELNELPDTDEPPETDKELELDELNLDQKDHLQ